MLDTIEFDRSVGVARDFAKRHPGTLVNCHGPITNARAPGDLGASTVHQVAPVCRWTAPSNASIMKTARARRVEDAQRFSGHLVEIG